MKQKVNVKYVRPLLVAALVVIGLTLLPAVTFSANPNPKVVPPISRSYGMTYGEWSARWWQWAISLPADYNPLTDTADCSTGQLGSVWFLGGAFYPASNPDVRNCNVPAGKALFFPIVNTECSDLEPDPWHGDTPATRRACAKANMDPPGIDPANLFAEIDGVSIQNLTQYRVMSPNFFFTAPDPNVLGVPGGSGQSVGDGYYLMVAPLPAGHHTIHFGGVFADWSLDITYYLNVKR
jgi:hypothetical protein